MIMKLLVIYYIVIILGKDNIFFRDLSYLYWYMDNVYYKIDECLELKLMLVFLNIVSSLCCNIVLLDFK